MHTVAPSSIKAWFHAPGLLCPPAASEAEGEGTRTSARAQMKLVLALAVAEAWKAVSPVVDCA